MKERAATKGRRYLMEGRLTVTAVEPDSIHARCRGDSGEVYLLGWNGVAGWWCSCPAVGRCAHVVAARLVTVVTPARTGSRG